AWILITYCTVNLHCNNFKNLTFSQIELFKKEWNSKISFLSYILQKDFLPQIKNATNISSENNLEFLLKSIKQDFEPYYAIDNILVLDQEGNIISSAYNLANRNFNISLKDRDYFKNAKIFPGQVHYGEIVIGKISK